ncbi:hypothetical protein MLD38_005669 [Melastoma candidum]|uniref:Uncharacterized protein n=1 Tax=Melastoma candidum TaxID=119954 RepID=A0ACB9RLL3_9MYRT|nr:hypothetical protein MLD38_005669 [Melastoma candidum]
MIAHHDARNGKGQVGNRPEEARLGILLYLGEADGVESRSCCSEEFEDSSSDEFVQMMVLDGVFVVELLRLYHKGTQVEMGTPVKEPIFATRWMLPNITRDLIMFENQLPMFRVG